MSYKSYVDCSCHGRHFYSLCLGACRSQVVTTQIQRSSADIDSLLAKLPWFGTMLDLQVQSSIFSNFPKGNEQCVLYLPIVGTSCPVGGWKGSSTWSRMKPSEA